MKKLRKIAGYIIDVLASVVFVVIISLYILQLIGIKPYIVMSASMEPKIQTGSVCLIDSGYDYSDIQVNDIIAYKAANGSMVTHRVIGIGQEGFETKGDNNEISDGFTTKPNNYMGRNIISIPYMGYMLQMIQTGKGRVIAVTCSVVLIAVYLLLLEFEKSERMKEVKKERAHSIYIK